MTMEKARLRFDRRGMTLVELMVSVAIFGIIMGVIMGFLMNARNSYNDTRMRAQTQQTLRATMNLLASEIRSAGCDPTDAGFNAFSLAGTGTFQCRMDLNGDSDFTDNAPDETVTYVFDAASGELSRDVGGGPQVILRDLTDMSFIYFDENGTQLAGDPLNAMDRERVRSVQILIAGETQHGEPVDYTARIALRNI